MSIPVAIGLLVAHTDSLDSEEAAAEAYARSIGCIVDRIDPAIVRADSTVLDLVQLYWAANDSPATGFDDSTVAARLKSRIMAGKGLLTTWYGNYVIEYLGWGVASPGGAWGPAVTGATWWIDRVDNSPVFAWMPTWLPPEGPPDPSEQLITYDRPGYIPVGNMKVDFSVPFTTYLWAEVLTSYGWPYHQFDPNACSQYGITCTGERIVTYGSFVELQIPGMSGHVVPGLYFPPSMNGKDGWRLGPAGQRLLGNMLEYLARPSPPAQTQSFSLDTEAREYRGMSFPLAFYKDSVRLVLSGLWPPDSLRWRVCTWDPDSKRYVEPTSGLDVLKPGQGYWLVTAQPAEVTALGVPIRDSVSVVVLGGDSTGWYQIGNPYMAPVADSSVAVRDYFNLTRVALTDPTNELTSRELMGWDPHGGGYARSRNLLPGDSYWVKKLVHGPVYLSIPNRASEPSTSPAAFAKPRGAIWALQIFAHQGDRACQPATVGAAAAPSGMWSRLCRPRPPNPPGRHLSLSLLERNRGVPRGEYSDVFRPIGDDMVWDLVVGAEGDGEVLLDVVGYDFPEVAEVWLSDPTRGWARRIAPGSSVSVVVSAGPRTLRLAVTHPDGTPAPTPPAMAFRQAQPNPFGRSTDLVFFLAAPGELRVDLFDVQGRRIRTFERRGLAAGEHVLSWDGRDGAGHRVGAGVYVARYQAAGRTGIARLVHVP